MADYRPYDVPSNHIFTDQCKVNFCMTSEVNVDNPKFILITKIIRDLIICWSLVEY